MTSISDLAEYEHRRRELIAEDRARRADHKRPPTEAEEAADKIVRDIRVTEARTLWAAEYPDIPHPFPGMEFLTAKEIIHESKLFKLLCKMPKGALLHVHLDATISVDFLMKLVYEHHAFHVRVPEPVTASNIHSIFPYFLAQPEGFIGSDKALTDLTYRPNSWVQLHAARASFSKELGGPEGFDKWVHGAMTINPAQAYGTHNTVKKIWQKFSTTFLSAFGLVRYKPVFTEYIRQFFFSSIEDGISYVEPRINFFLKYGDGTAKGGSVEALQEHGYCCNREMLQIYDRVLNEVKTDLKQQGREDEFIGAKVIYTTLRFIEPQELIPYMEDCIALKKEFPHLIAGFDLVGDENELFPLKYYMKELLTFRARQEEAGVEIPFILHAGETLGDGTEADMNLYDAILLGTKRIGHGFSLVKHPKLMEICRERNVALEVCPISNEILRLTSSMPMHPLPVLFNHGIRIALCSDDPSVFGSMGLSYDYYQVIAASEITGLLQLGAVARDSLSLSMLDDHDKELALAAFQRRWEIFLQHVIAEGGNI